jgi:hypothetical protein
MFCLLCYSKLSEIKWPVHIENISHSSSPESPSSQHQWIQCLMRVYKLVGGTSTLCPQKGEGTKELESYSLMIYSLPKRVTIQYITLIWGRHQHSDFHLEDSLSCAHLTKEAWVDIKDKTHPKYLDYTYWSKEPAHHYEQPEWLRFHIWKRLGCGGDPCSVCHKRRQDSEEDLLGTPWPEQETLKLILLFYNYAVGVHERGIWWLCSCYGTNLCSRDLSHQETLDVTVKAKAG